jgi:predicted nucleic acid-binding Zn ribbon protein
VSKKTVDTSIVRIKPDTDTRINSFFDRAELCVERSDKLLSKSKPAVVNLFLFLHLLIDLIVVLVVLMWKLS